MGKCDNMDTSCTLCRSSRLGVINCILGRGLKVVSYIATVFVKERAALIKPSYRVLPLVSSINDPSLVSS